MGRTKESPMDQMRRVADAASEMKALATNMPDLRIVAMDLEYGDERVGFTELGLAIWDRGRRTGRQIFVGDQQGNGAYIHGESERMSLSDACAVIEETMRGANGIAGHDLSGDRTRLKALGIELPHVPVYDTARMSKRLFVPPSHAQLRAMLQIYGLPSQGLHVAGNDAWAVIDLLCEMARQGPSPCAGPDGGYLHPSRRPDLVRDRYTGSGYVMETGNLERSERIRDEPDMVTPTGF